MENYRQDEFLATRMLILYQDQLWKYLNPAVRPFGLSAAVRFFGSYFIEADFRCAWRALKLHIFAAFPWQEKSIKGIRDSCYFFLSSIITI